MIAKCLRVFFISFILGVGLGSLFLVPINFLTFGTLLLVVFLGSLIDRRVIFVACCVIGFAFGTWYTGETFGLNEFENYFGQQIDVEGIISVEPEIVERNQQLTVRLDGFSQDLRASIYQPVNAHARDRVWVRGVVAMPENFSDFDYIGYLQRYNVYAQLKKPKVIVLKPAGESWQTPFQELRRYLLARSNKLFAKDPGSLIMGMLIGYRESMTDSITENFRKTGLMHVVAVSGFNMTILASACILLASYIGRKPAGVATVLAIGCFVMIAGASASVVRSAIMALLVVSAQFSGRLYNSRHALVLAAGIMVLLNPRIVIWDVGFQLSVLATLGVLYAYELKRDQEQSTMFSTLRPTLGAIIATAPLSAFHFQTFSTVAPLANLILLPLVPWIMLFGALSFLPLLGRGLSFCASLLASVMLKCVSWFAAIPYSSLGIKLNAPVIIGIYLFLFVVVQIVLRKKQNRVLPRVGNRGKL